MPAIHHETFRARYHECDALGYLKHIDYLRWMQEAAFAASAAVGYDFARYDRMGHLWLIRFSDIEYLAPVRYGDEVRVKTWVVDMRRFRSLRAYEMREAASDALAARATTDWIYVNVETLRPVVVPDAMQLAFFPEGVPEKPVRRERYPDPPPARADGFSYRRDVAWHDVDTMWHVNNAKYLAYLEEAEQRACAAHGWPVQRMVEEGVGVFTRHHHIEYRQPAVLGDTLEIATWCSDATPDAALRHYEIRRESDGELLVQARAHWGCVNLETGGAVDIPEELACIR